MRVCLVVMSMGGSVWVHCCIPALVDTCLPACMHACLHVRSSIRRVALVTGGGSVLIVLFVIYIIIFIGYMNDIKVFLWV